MTEQADAELNAHDLQQGEDAPLFMVCEHGFTLDEGCFECSGFDAVMWGWLTPVHERIVNHWVRTGDIPDRA